MKDLKVEQKFHDSKVHLFLEDEGESFFKVPPKEAIKNDVWLKHFPEILGDLTGKSVLDCGCGTGFISATLSQNGAKVTAFDLSNGMLKVAQKRASSWKLDIPLVESAFEKLPFKDNSFDFVVGAMILHHTELEGAVSEIKRVLKKDGKILFLETQLRNVFLRTLVESPIYKIRFLRHGSPCEKPLTLKSLKYIKSEFTGVRFHYFSFIFLQLIGSIIARPLRKTMLEKIVLSFFVVPDSFVTKCFPALRKYSYWVMVGAVNNK
jgi:ubiquinone/menaquinone biosynthesis C-methylase UbiE